MQETHALDGHFGYGRLIRFVVPSVAMMLFVSIYGVVDGIFVSNFVGKTPFAALNLIYPCLMVFATVGFMIGTGGSALIGKTLGEGETDRANRLFTMLLATAALAAVVILVVGFTLMPEIAALLGAEGEMLRHAVIYGRTFILGLPGFVLQNVFQSFFVTAGKPRLGLAVTVTAGVTNIVLDAVFVGWLRWGLVGAASATALSQAVGGLLPLVYFARKNSSLLRLSRFRFEWSPIWRTCVNGSSELMSNLSMSLIVMLYNVQLLRLAGENGVAAYGVVMYVDFIFISIFIGYAVGGAAPVSFHFGAGNRTELRSLLRKGLVLMSATGVVLAVTAFLLAPTLSRLFVGYDAALYEMTVRAFRFYTVSFLFAGINIFSSSFFTALNNGLVSALLAFSRTLVFQIAALYLLPLWLGLDGVWLAITVADIPAIAMAIAFLVRERRRGALSGADLPRRPDKE